MIKPWRVTIDTNPDQCNLNCIMCDTHSIFNTTNSISRKAMDVELLKKVIDDTLQLGVKEIIPSTMGEPLMYKHFDIFIEKIQHSNSKLNLTTNGTFPIHSVEIWAKKLLPILSDIKISINALDATINEKIMPNDNTICKIDDIKKFVKLRDAIKPDVSITLQVTFLESNLDELEKLIIFAIEHKINRVKGHQLWITFQEVQSESLQRNKYSIERWNQFIDKVSKYKNQITLVNFNKIDIYNDELDAKGECPFLGKELWVDHEGTFNICCAPSNKRITLGQWGNIKDISIIDMFNSPEYSNILQTYKDHNVCKECSLRY